MTECEHDLKRDYEQFPFVLVWCTKCSYSDWKVIQ